MVLLCLHQITQCYNTNKEATVTCECHRSTAAAATWPWPWGLGCTNPEILKLHLVQQISVNQDLTPIGCEILVRLQYGNEMTFSIFYLKQAVPSVSLTVYLIHLFYFNRFMKRFIPFL